MKTKLLLTFFASLFSIGLCHARGNDAIRIEAEVAALSGNLKIETARKGFSGAGYVSNFNQAKENKFTLRETLPRAGHYRILVRAASDHYKENALLADGKTVGTIVTESPEFATRDVGIVWLDAGEHAFSIREVWGWFDLDFVELVPTEAISEEVFSRVDAVPCNPKANEKTRRVMKFLAENYGKKIIAGQYAAHNESYEIEALRAGTGKEPALRGFDMIFYSPNADWHFDGEVPLAMAWSERGGLVSFSWHWHAPTGAKKFYAKESDFDLGAAMATVSPTDTDLATMPLEEIRALREAGKISEHTYRLFADIDAISAQLARLQTKNVTVLWRPLHEAAGGWFWWGAHGKELYLWLYRTMWRRQTELHGLNNLIWVWNGQHADWYPGDEFVDVVGDDIYAEKRDYGANSGQFLRAVAMSGGKKMVALTECGVIPDPEVMRRDGAMWLWFNTWYGQFIVDEKTKQLDGVFTDNEMLRKIYTHKDVMTLDEADF